MRDEPSAEGTASSAGTRQGLMSLTFVLLAFRAVACLEISRSMLKALRLVEPGLYTFRCLVVLLGSLVIKQAGAF